MNPHATSNAVRRAALLERCQSERNDLIAMTASARALAPRAQAWARAVRTLYRLLRALTTRTHRATGKD